MGFGTNSSQDQRFEQIRSANQNISGILHQRLIYINGQQISHNHAPSTKLQVKSIPVSVDKTSIQLGADQITVVVRISQPQSGKHAYVCSLHLVRPKLNKSEARECRATLKEHFQRLFNAASHTEALSSKATEDQYFCDDTMETLHTAQCTIEVPMHELTQVKFELPKKINLDALYAIITVQQKSKTKQRKLVSVAGVVAGEVTEVRQKFFAGGQEFAVNEVFKVEGQTPDAVHGRLVPPTEGESECIVCFSNAKDVILLPCRHFCLCRPCSLSVKFHTNQCPICREQVTRYVEIDH
jgi:uncharacterized protein YqcC (DUF446 family)